MRDQTVCGFATNAIACGLLFACTWANYAWNSRYCGFYDAHEQGLSDFDVPTWYALFAPKGTPSDIVQKLNRATMAALQSPIARQRMKEIGSGLVEPARMTPEYLGSFVRAEIDKWAAVIRANEKSLE